MRHLKHRHKLGVKTAHRGALLANMTASLILHKKIQTTLAKAKALRPFAEQVITLAKKAHAADSAEKKLHYRRQAVSKVRDQEAVALLFSERVEEFLNRSGGYTRIYKLVPRQGDAADLAIIELIDADDEGYTKPKKGRKRSRKSAAAKAEAVEEVVEESEEIEDEETVEVEEAAEEPSSEEVSEESDNEKK
ncbi:MAG: 50S ribosomal protein L17 [Verrucomicrobiota bacterium]